MSIKRILSITWDVLFYAFIIISLGLTISLSRAHNPGEGPSVFGYKFYTVLTGSMSPTIGKGYLTIVKEVDPSEIKVDDVITFGNTSNNSVTTHRVKEIDSSNGIKFITKGDANNTIDPAPVEAKLLVGKVVSYIPMLGATLEVIRENIKLAVIFLVVITFLGVLPDKVKRDNEVKEDSI